MLVIISVTKFNYKTIKSFLDKQEASTYWNSICSGKGIEDADQEVDEHQLFIVNEVTHEAAIEEISKEDRKPDKIFRPEAYVPLHKILKTTGPDRVTAATLSRAATDIKKQTNTFQIWTKANLKRMSEIVNTINTSKERNDADFNTLIDLSYDIKAQGASFDYPLLSLLSDRLVVYSEGKGARNIGSYQITVIKAHVSAMNFILNKRIQGNGGNVGKGILAKLDQFIAGKPVAKKPVSKLAAPDNLKPAEQPPAPEPAKPVKPATPEIEEDETGIISQKELEQLLSQGKASENDDQREDLIISKSDLIWTKSAEIGIGQIDDDHKYIFHLIGRYFESGNKDDDILELNNIFVHLQTFAMLHFRREELAMEICGYAQRVGHSETHAELLKDLDKKRREALLLSREDSHHHISLMFREWIQNHILKDDLLYREAMLQKSEEIEKELAEIETGKVWLKDAEL